MNNDDYKVRYKFAETMVKLDLAEKVHYEKEKKAWMEYINLSFAKEAEKCMAAIIKAHNEALIFGTSAIKIVWDK